MHDIYIIVIGALLAFLQGAILFILLGFRSSIEDIWEKFNCIEKRCITHEGRLGNLEGKVNSFKQKV